MKALVLLSVLALFGCEKPAVHADPSPLKAHWSDQTILSDYPTYALVCNDDGRVIGSVTSVGNTTWYSWNMAGRETEFETRIEAEIYLIKRSTCEATP